MSNLNQLLKTSIIKTKHASLQHPTAFSLSSEGMLSAPRSIILNGVVSYGGSTGFGLELTQKAFGEYYERNHFFTSVPITSKKTLAETQPESHQKKLRSLCNASASSAFTEHQFTFTDVYNLFDETPCDYFFNAISLHGIKADTTFLNVTDSCACASHITKERALYQSMIEFLERQSLIGSWVSKTYRYTINPQLLKELSPYDCLVEKLLENGDIYIFENGNHLPGYSVIMFYFSHCSTDAVQYSVGSKSASSLSAALTSAFEELYQCYTFLYSAVFKPTNLENKPGAGYHLAFTTYNTANTKSIIPFLENIRAFKINTAADLLTLPTYSFQDMLLGLQQLTPNVYFYHYYEKSLQLHFTKIFSPDFFSHMSLNKALNLNNLYAQKLNITPDNAYLEKLPFP
jgi:hypothetical protein